MKKVVFGVFLVGLIAAIITVLVGGYVPTSNSNTNYVVVLATMSGAALMFALNFLGLEVGKLLYGTVGMLIAFGLLGYGIYVLVKKDTLFKTTPEMVPIVGGISTGVGGLGVLTSTGVLAL